MRDGNEGQPDLRDSFALRVEEKRSDQAVPHSPIGLSSFRGIADKACTKFIDGVTDGVVITTVVP
jgi:hypothetical protein